MSSTVVVTGAAGVIGSHNPPDQLILDLADLVRFSDKHENMTAFPVDLQIEMA